MSFGYSSYPSILWAGIAIVLLVGGTIGMMHRNLKRIILSKYPEKLPFFIDHGCCLDYDESQFIFLGINGGRENEKNHSNSHCNYPNN
ncbi:hypothetical protein [Ammoniphilus resinae]|uniref:Uncharacterized protein n=1 Tax=Ammoniphilus resinae TaxID=861532 RepID=A0ABS4GU56_9BACL|nr:hypothetical protein [Ammoniphilus resinae]MBP1933657.1 hypothetical protein [Ammoniphilus resinae]